MTLTSEQPQTVYVIMGNDFPECVFDNKQQADAFVKDKTEEDKKEYSHRRVFWRVFSFPLLGKGAK